MEITEVKIFPKEGQKNRLRAYASVTFDNAFVVRNIKIIEGRTGLFVAMPSRKMKESCPKCNHKNEVRSKFCNECGASIPLMQVNRTNEGFHQDERVSEHRDIAHPITVQCREYIERKILDAYESEKKETYRMRV